MTTSAKRFLAGGGLLFVLPLVAALAARRQRTEAAPQPPDPQEPWRERFTYLTQGDAARAWVYAAGALASGGEGEYAREPRKLLALTALSLADLAEARRQIKPVAGPGSPRDPLFESCYAHPAEAAALRALIAEARGDTRAAQGHWLEVARSGHPVLGVVARHALADLCPRIG